MKACHYIKAVPVFRHYFGLCALMVSAALLVACQSNIRKTPQNLPWHEARQLVLVTTADGSATTGTLASYLRGTSGWRATGFTTPVSIGRSGVAWGLGLHPQQAGLQKQEGDGRSPAGIFHIGPAFGYAQSIAIRMPYLPMRASSYCIDAPTSAFYNQIVDTREAGNAEAADSTEPMRRDLQFNGDQVYKLGFVIEHNRSQIAGAGSCIFGHLWRAADQATAGCTAMPEAAMTWLLDWLQPELKPIFVLLTESDYRRLRKNWQLP